MDATNAEESWVGWVGKYLAVLPLGHMNLGVLTCYLWWTRKTMKEIERWENRLM
jgi:hypothetical protein